MSAHTEEGLVPRQSSTDHVDEESVQQQRVLQCFVLLDSRVPPTISILTTWFG